MLREIRERMLKDVINDVIKEELGKRKEVARFLKSVGEDVPPPIMLEEVGQLMKRISQKTLVLYAKSCL